MSVPKTTIEYIFEETGSKVIDYGNNNVAFFLCADRDFTDDERMREALWCYVVCRMIYESRSNRKPIFMLVDLHKTHGKPISRVVGKMYKDILECSHHISKISIVGDFFQSAPFKQIVMLLPDLNNKISFFLSYNKATKWLKWTH